MFSFLLVFICVIAAKIKNINFLKLHLLNNIIKNMIIFVENILLNLFIVNHKEGSDDE